MIRFLHAKPGYHAMQMSVSSVNVGRVETRTDARGKPGKTGIGKMPVSGTIKVSKVGLDGDQSAYRPRDLGDTAVHMFCTHSYRMLAEQVGFELPVPCFGENLTVDGLVEKDVRIGDLYRIGTVLLHVNQPVVRCNWPGVVASEPKLLKWILKLRLTGFYLDVLEEGELQAGDLAPVDGAYFGELAGENEWPEWLPMDPRRQRLERGGRPRQRRGRSGENGLLPALERRIPGE